GVPLSLLAQYRVVIWNTVVTSGTTSSRTALHQMIDPATGASNNLFTYLQAGGNLWLFGQAPGRELSVQAFNPLTAANVRAQDFVFDLLGIRGNDTLFTNNLARRSDGEYNSFLRAVDPWPTPFVRQTPTGR